MSDPAADARARRLAAIEARLNPPREDDGSPDGSTGASTPNASARAPPRNMPKPWTRPGPREETERRRELARLLNRSIIRDSGYRQAAECVETLVKIATNIQTSPDPKFRTLRAENSLLKNKVLAVPGGREYMIQMGFHTENREFTQFFVLDQSEKRLWQLGLAAEVLKESLPELKKRVNGTTASTSNAKAEEERRVAAAKRQIEADREVVRQRVERERIVRDAREARRQQAEAEPQPQDEPHFYVRGKGQTLAGDTSTAEEEEEEGGEGAQQHSVEAQQSPPSVGPSDDADMLPSDPEEGDEDGEHGEGDDGDETDEEERAFRRKDTENRMGMFGMASNAHHWGGGQKLGE